MYAAESVIYAAVDFGANSQSAAKQPHYYSLISGKWPFDSEELSRTTASVSLMAVVHALTCNKWIVCEKLRGRRRETDRENSLRIKVRRGRSFGEN